MSPITYGSFTEEQNEIYLALTNSGYLHYFIILISFDGILRGRVEPRLVEILLNDMNYANSDNQSLPIPIPDWLLHTDVGTNLISFRKYNNREKSLHITISRDTFECAIDLDKGNPSQDLIGTIVHLGELIKKYIWIPFTKLWRR